MVLNNKVILNDGGLKGLGYRKGLNSIKDYDDQDDPLLANIMDAINTSLGIAAKYEKQTSNTIQKAIDKAETKAVDLAPNMSPVRDQGYLGSCTAYAATGMVEYMQKKAYKKYHESSTLFTYKTTRNLMRETGDTGAYMRSVMGSIAMIGVAPEEYWPYDGREEPYNNKFDVEPPNFVYHLAQNYQSLKYIRLDQPNITTVQLVDKLKYYLRFMKIPAMFGFTVYDSISQSSDAENRGLVPYPSKNEQVLGGHAILLAGYDDNIVIRNSKDPIVMTTGAFKFKNSWGNNWGLDGYGYLPYEYFLNRLADDCWILMSQEWIDAFQFQE